VLDHLLQTLLLRASMGIIVQGPNDLFKAIRQDFGTPFQVAPKTSLLSSHFAASE
jgi:hypothetical protein